MIISPCRLFPQVTGRAVDRLEPCGGGQNGIALWLLIQDRSRLHHPYYRRINSIEYRTWAYDSIEMKLVGQFLL